MTGILRDPGLVLPLRRPGLVRRSGARRRVQVRAWAGWLLARAAGIACLLLTQIAPVRSAALVVDTLAEAIGNGGIVQHPVTTDLYVGDFGNLSQLDGTRVSIVALDGGVSTLDAILGRSNDGNAFDTALNFYQASYASGLIWKVTPEGVATIHAQVPGPIGLEFDEAGNLFAASCTTSRIYRIAPDGAVSVLAAGGALNCPNGLTIDRAGNLVTCNWADGGLVKISPQGAMSLLARVPNAGNGHVEYDALRDVFYVAGRTSHRLYEVSPSGEVRVLAGSGIDGNADGPAAQARFSRPNGIAVSRDGRFVFSNGDSAQDGSANAIRRVLLDDPGVAIHHGLAGAWYEPATSGQGLLVEVMPDISQVFVAWFTFADAAASKVGAEGQRWVTGLGEYEGSIAELVLYTTSGGAFDQPLPRPETVEVGRASIRFLDCHRARFEYAFAGGGFGSIELSRPALGQPCAPPIQP